MVRGLFYRTEPCFGPIQRCSIYVTMSFGTLLDNTGDIRGYETVSQASLGRGVRKGSAEGMQRKTRRDTLTTLSYIVVG